MADVLISNLGLPTDDEQINITILSDGSVIEHFRTEKGRWTSYRSGGVKAIEVEEAKTGVVYPTESKMWVEASK